MDETPMEMMYLYVCQAHNGNAKQDMTSHVSIHEYISIMFLSVT